jgi:alkylated DNA nucleotide flippase Atl1
VRLPNPVDEMVLAVVASIPHGQLVSYADVADICAQAGTVCGARRVARTLAQFGEQVPWWRVVRSDGTLAAAVRHHAQRRLADEGVQVDGSRVPLEALRWWPDPEQFVPLKALSDPGASGHSMGS